MITLDKIQALPARRAGLEIERIYREFPEGFLDLRYYDAVPVASRVINRVAALCKSVDSRSREWSMGAEILCYALRAFMASRFKSRASLLRDREGMIAASDFATLKSLESWRTGTGATFFTYAGNGVIRYCVRYQQSTSEVQRTSTEVRIENAVKSHPGASDEELAAIAKTTVRFVRKVRSEPKPMGVSSLDEMVSHMGVAAFGGGGGALIDHVPDQDSAAALMDVDTKTLVDSLYESMPDFEEDCRMGVKIVLDYASGKEVDILSSAISNGFKGYVPAGIVRRGRAALKHVLSEAC